MHISAYDVLALKIQPGGHIFTKFVDAVIRAHCSVAGVLQSNIKTNLRTNVADKGVDTRVKATIANDSLGWLTAPTIWQYKATDFASVSESMLRAEIHKEHSAKCVRLGYAYRFAICDSLPDHKCEEWETLLNSEANSLNSNAQEAKVVTADDLATWANLFPAILSRFFHKELPKLCLLMPAWGKNVTSTTSHYVDIPDWHPIQGALRKHLDFSQQVADVVIPIIGEAGAGKTRMVYETLLQNAASHSLVLYVDDDGAAAQIARLLANDSEFRAILIADECSKSMRGLLRTNLKGHKDRIRVVAIDNSGEMELGVGPKYSVTKITKDLVVTVLKSNFPQVSDDRIRSYSELSQGFVRLAADMCEHDSELGASGRAVSNSIRSYYHERLTDEQRSVIEALALFSKLGHRDEVEHELQEAGSLLEIEPNLIKNTAKKLHDSPGFIAKAGRYYYVTPEIIAQVAFDEAWQRWCSSDPKGFMDQMPPALLKQFMRRVATSSDQEVRRTVGEYFLQWAGSLAATDLGVIETMDRLVVLCETDPTIYVPLIHRLINESTEEQLRQLEGEEKNGHWGPRRVLIFLLERMAAIPEHFYHIEDIFYKLATAESEPSIANNATGEWKKLFQILLSGTSLPFKNRFAALRLRVRSTDQPGSDLALKVVGSLLDTYAVGTARGAVVAGTVPPDQWLPKTNLEYRECFDLILEFLRQISNGSDLRLRESTARLAISNLLQLLRWRYLDQVQLIVAPTLENPKIRAELLAALQEYLHFDAHSTETDPKQIAYNTKVKEYLDSLKPNDIHSRVVACVGVDHWFRSAYRNDNTIGDEYAAIGSLLFETRSLLEAELDWLFTPEAKGAWVLGKHIGRLDESCELLMPLIEMTLSTGATGFTRGYVWGNTEAYVTNRDMVNLAIDQMEQESPALAYDLFFSGGTYTKPLERTLRLVGEGLLSVQYLKSFVHGEGGKPLSIESFAAFLRNLVTYSKDGSEQAAAIGLDAVAARLEHQEKNDPNLQRLFDDLDMLEVIWTFMELPSAYEAAGQNSYDWKQILKQLADKNPEKTAHIAARAIMVHDLFLDEAADEILSTIAETNPKLVLAALKVVMLDQEWGWKFLVSRHKSLIETFQDEDLIEWVSAGGVELAERLARHLPAPYLDEEHQPTVPPVTEFVLKTFGDDKDVFTEFCAGHRSGEIMLGNLADHMRKDAELARHFVNHPLRQIRDWAIQEITVAEAQANWWDTFQEETFPP